MSVALQMSQSIDQAVSSTSIVAISGNCNSHWTVTLSIPMFLIWNFAQTEQYTFSIMHCRFLLCVRSGSFVTDVMLPMH